MTPLTTAWLAEVALITYRDFKKGSANNLSGFPLPADYLATFAIFGILGLFDGASSSRLTGAIGWGYVVATFLNLFNPTLSSGQASLTSSGGGSGALGTAQPGTKAAGTPTTTTVQ